MATVGANKASQTGYFCTTSKVLLCIMPKEGNKFRNKIKQDSRYNCYANKKTKINRRIIEKI